MSGVMWGFVIIVQFLRSVCIRNSECLREVAPPEPIHAGHKTAIAFALVAAVGEVCGWAIINVDASIKFACGKL